MRSLFQMDGPIFSFLNRLADLVMLNILFIMCCIPIFTIGASLSALYSVTLKMAQNEEGYIVRGFFKAFRQNFKQGTGIWLLCLAFGGILVLDYLIIAGRIADTSALPKGTIQFMLIFLLALSLVFLLVFRYLFPLLAKFDNTVKNIIRNAFLISIIHLPYSLLLLLIPLIPLLLTYWMPAWLFGYFMLFFSLEAYVSSFLFVRIFAKYMPKEAAETEAEEQNERNA